MSQASELPANWTWAEIAEISLPGETWSPKTAKAKDFSYIDIEAVDNVRQRIVAPKKLQVTEAPSRARVSVRAGDVLFSLVRPYLKNIAIVPQELDGQVASTAFIAVRPADGIDSSFVFRQILRDLFINSVPTYGNSPPSARDDEFVRLKIPVAPTKEQQRISNKIDELLSDLDAGVAALERARANLKRYRAAVLKAAVEGKLTEHWRKAHPDVEPASKLLERILAERRTKWEEAQLAKFAAASKAPSKGWKAKYHEPAKPDTANLPELPEGWCWTSLSQLGFLDRGRSRHRPRNASFLFGGRYPFIQTGEVGEADTFIRTYTQTYSDAGLAQSKLWPMGTLCITIAANIAETGILTFEACFPDSVVGFLPVGDDVSVRYVELYLRTTQAKLESLAPATAQKNINLDTLQHVAVCLPPVQEQLHLVEIVDERLSLAKQAVTQIEQDFLRSSCLRQAILKRAFEGKLVPQDPNDEPATVLLERIRDARAAEGMQRAHKRRTSPA